MAATTTTLTSSTNPSVFGQAVTFTATVAVVLPDTGTPTGVVTFLLGGNSIGTGNLNASGIALFTTSALAFPGGIVSASYAGDGTFDPSSGNMTGNPQIVQRASTNVTVTSSLNPAMVGQDVTLTATVAVVAPGTGVPGGTVTFRDQGQEVGGVPLVGGVATLTLRALRAGTHTVIATYDGQGGYQPSTAPLTGNPQVVNQPVPVTLKPLNTLALAASTPTLLVGPMAGNYTLQLLGTGPIEVSQDPGFSSFYSLPASVPFLVPIWGPQGIWVQAGAAGSLSVALIPR